MPNIDPKFDIKMKILYLLYFPIKNAYKPFPNIPPKGTKDKMFATSAGPNPYG